MILYGDSYENYFNWLINGFDNYQKNKLDALKFKNTKHLFYRFNDFLSESNAEIKKKSNIVLSPMILLQLKKFKMKIGNIILNNI